MTRSRLLFLIFAIGLCNGGWSAPVHIGSRAALEDFQQRFPDAQYVVQTQNHRHVRFDFFEQEIHKQALYSLQGIWQATMSQLPHEQLPAAIRADLRLSCRGSVEVAYQLHSRHFFAPLYLSFVPNSKWETPDFLPAHAMVGTYLRLGDIPTACLVSRWGMSALPHPQGRFVVLMHHGSGRGLASQEVQRLLQQALIPLPLKAFPLSGELPQTDALPNGWYPCEWGW